MTFPIGPDDEPLVNSTDKYAVVSSKICDQATLIPVQSFKTVEELIEGFQDWLGMSTEEVRETLKPVEVIGSKQYKVLTDILEKYK